MYTKYYIIQTEVIQTNYRTFLSEEITLNTTNSQLSVGTGIAIVGVWLPCMTTTIIMLMINFVWSAPETEQLSSDAALMMLLIIFLPMFVAYYATKLILGKDT